MKPVNEHDYIYPGRRPEEWEALIREGSIENHWVRLRRIIVETVGDEYVAWCPDPHDIKDIVGVGLTPESAIKAFQKAVAKW